MHTYKPEQIDSQIALVARDAGRLQDKIHALAYAVLLDWRKTDNGDVAADRLSRLQSASPYHADAFSKWTANFLSGHLVWNKDKEVWVAKEGVSFKDNAKAILKGVKDTPFYKFKPASAPKPYDDIDAFEAFYASAKARAKDAEKKENVTVHPAYQNALDEMMRKVREIKAAA